MKRLPILFSIVLLLVSAVVAQKNPKDKTSVKQDSTVVLRDGPEPSKEELAANAAKGYPVVPDSIMRAPLVKLDGAVFTLEEYRGKAVLLHLYATWSGPDRAEVPRLIELQEKYKDSGLTIIALNAGNGNGKPEDRKTIEKFAKRMKTNYDLVQEVSFGVTTDTIKKLTVFNGVPQTILIDREGKLRGIFLGGGARVAESRKETVEKLMNEK